MTSGMITVGPSVPPAEVYVTFSAEINVNTTESLIATMTNLANQGVPNVTLLLSTPGGTVMDGMNVYNVLRAMPFELTTHNVGNVDSIGNAVFLAGEHRFAAPHSTFMFHGVGFQTQPGQVLEEKILRERLGGLQADQTRIGQVIAERTNLQPDAISALFLEAQTKDATYAIGAGIVHEVRDAKIPAGTPVISLVFKR